ncbi:hypothetical protein Ahy_B07g086396 isoform C [Arachis hypogaea]|uniref:Uncharacterized protein n=1 Tax=Arachis hypogaea TaxID=3818 RepID=A0A444Y9J1_ARAHY|nr:hypothetical protein Ahy_B07g086396 isoform C [Arachis hypogaea]
MIVQQFWVCIADCQGMKKKDVTHRSSSSGHSKCGSVFIFDEFGTLFAGTISFVHEYAILLNLGSLQAIAMKDCVLIFEYNRLNPKNSNGGLSMPFELEIWLQLAYSWMRFFEEIKAILGTIVKHKDLLVSNEKIGFFLFKFIMRKTCILFAYV